MAGRRRGKKNKLQNLEEGPSVALAPPPRTKPILVGVESNVKSSQQGSRLPSPPSSQAKTDPPPFPRAHRNSRLKPEGDENGNAGRGSNVANLANSGIGSGVVQRRASKRPNTPPQCDRISLRNAACEDQRVDRGFNHCEIRGMEMAAAGIVLVCVVFAVIGVFSGSKKMVEKVDSALINVATLHEAVNQNKEKQSEAETRLASMERALDSMVEKYGMLQEEPTQEGGEEPVNWFRNRVEEIVEAKLDTYTADITGLPDYALATAGASVVGHSALLRGFHLCTWSSFALWPCFIEFCMECSKTMGFGAQMIHPLADELVLRPGTLPGRCLPLAGSSGSIDVRLRAPVAITAITLEHIDKRIAYRGQWSPAVKEFEVWGFNATRKGKGMEGFEELGRYAFEEDGRHVQTFDMVDGKLPVSHIRLKIISNHGSGDYTCLYRVRVHGNEM